MIDGCFRIANGVAATNVVAAGPTFLFDLPGLVGLVAVVLFAGTVAGLLSRYLVSTPAARRADAKLRLLWAAYRESERGRESERKATDWDGRRAADLLRRNADLEHEAAWLERQRRIAASRSVLDDRTTLELIFGAAEDFAPAGAGDGADADAEAPDSVGRVA